MPRSAFGRNICPTTVMFQEDMEYFSPKSASVNKTRLLLFFLLLFTQNAFSQTRGAVVSGSVVDENEAFLRGVSISVLGLQKVVTTSDSGHFRLAVPANRAFALLFSHAGYQTIQRNFLLNEGEEELIKVRMEP
ncbi:MAG: carboxypeptidase-like regulatory domain-containing protein, partial [Chitinophagaceae bacterium]